MLTVGVVGCGYWGPNLIRNFMNLQGADVRICADISEKRLQHMKGLYPSIEVTRDYMDIVKNPKIDAVVVSTPVSAHFEVAKAALDAGKHVFVEKPLTRTVEEGVTLVGIAEKKKQTLMVGHTFVFTAAVNKIKELIDSGELGDIYYISTSRVNLGIFQDDINVVWDLAPHDISIMNFTLNSRPDSVSAIGHSYIRPGIEAVSYTHLTLPTKRIV